LTLKEIKDLVRFLKKEKVIVFKIEGLEGQFDPSCFYPDLGNQPLEKTKLDEYTDEELFHSGV